MPYWERTSKLTQIKVPKKDCSIEDLERVLEQREKIFERHQVKGCEILSKATHIQTPQQLEMRIRLRKKLEKKKISKS